MGTPPPAPAAALIVNYRSYAELTRCLESLASERVRVSETIVVDHQSDAAAASRIAGRFPWARVLPVPGNPGFAAGVNWAARHSQAPYLLLINPDCVVTSGAGAHLIDFLEHNPDIGVAGPRILNSDGTVQGSARRFPGLTTAFAGRSSWLTRVAPGNPLSRWNLPCLDEHAAPRDVDWVSGACMLIRRRAFEAAGGMDERFFLYWEDADLCRRLHAAGWRVVYYPAATVIHAGGRSSIHARRESLVAFHQSAFALFEKYARGPARLLLPAVYVGLRVRLQALLTIHRRQLRQP